MAPNTIKTIYTIYTFMGIILEPGAFWPHFCVPFLENAANTF